MALTGQEILYFMSVGVAATPIPDHSFEELRIRDYLKAYQSTGRPPVPCPQSPDTPTARAALGLPPLFVPAAIPVPSDNPVGMRNLNASNAPTTLPTDLPTTHEFRPTKTSGPASESFESICAQTLYAHFSQEELRYHAYHAGNKTPPTPVDGAGTVHPFYALDTPATAFFTLSAVPGTPDYLMAIVASPKFEKHSFEELRIACLLAGKEVGSSEIPTRGALPAQSTPAVFGRPRGDAFSSGSLKLF